MARSALFVIDIQGELAINPKTRIPHAERIKSAGDKILTAARSIIDTYRDKGEQSPSIIVFVQQEDEDLIKGSDQWKLVFEPRDGIDEEVLIAKTTRNTFESNPDLAERLQREGITEIVTFGIQSECCVLATSQGALALGFSVTLLQGAHSTYDITAEKEEEVVVEAQDNSTSNNNASPSSSEPKEKGRKGRKRTAVEVERDVEDEVARAGARLVPWEDAIVAWAQRRMISSYPLFSELV